MSEENTNKVVEETTQTTEDSAPAPGSPEYNAQMAAEGEAAMGNVPDKFKNEDGSVNIEAMAQSYLELERKQSAPQEEKPAGVEEEKQTLLDGPDAPVDELRVPETVEPTEEAAPIEEQAKTVGVTADDLADMTTSIMRTGGISDEQRSMLNTRGIDDAVINAMVDGQRSKMRDQYAQAADIVGSADRLSKIFGWAAQNLSPEQRDSVNAGLASPNSEMTLLGLAAQYDRAQVKVTPSKEPQRITRTATLNDPASRQVVQGFASKAEMYQAMDAAKANPALMPEYEQKMRATPNPTILP